jgi:methyl-accepting chemotaxis protein
MKLFSRVSFKSKLISLCLFLSAVSVVIGVVSYNGLDDVSDSYEEVTDKVMPSMNLLNDMFLHYRRIRINLRTLGLPGLPKVQADDAIAKAIESMDAYEEANKAFVQIPFDDGEKALYDEVQTHWLHFKEVGHRALDLYKSGKPEDHAALLNIFFVDCPATAEKFTKAMENIKKSLNEKGKRYVDKSKSYSDRTNQKIAAIALIGILIGVGLGALIASAISASIANVAQHLSQSAAQVASASSQIASASEELSQASTEQAASLEETAASLEQISAMIAKAADGATATANSSTHSQRQAEHGRVTVDQMLSSMGEISESNEAIMSQISESNRKMTEIVNVIQEIGTRTKVINEIVFQTKLLSFNASVEAARAGEHGKGFAVVAEEVGNLAQMSGNAAKEISDMLDNSISKVESIVVETKTKVERLAGEGRIKVESGTRVALECSKILIEIVQNVTQVSSLAGEISQASLEQSQGVSEINKAMGQLDIVTQRNASASEETASAAQALSAQTETLKEAVQELMKTLNGAKESSAGPSSQDVSLNVNGRRGARQIISSDRSSVAIRAC